MVPFSNQTCSIQITSSLSKTLLIMMCLRVRAFCTILWHSVQSSTLIQDGDKSVPPPLRNDYYPNGLPWLTKDVGKANELYRIACELIFLCQSRDILWSCENPGRSFMWQTKSFVELSTTSTTSINCTSLVTTNTNASLGDRKLMGRGPHPKRQPIHGLLPGP